MRSDSRTFGLDVIRCAAILCVLACHTGYFLEERSGRLEATLLYLGYIGVELFFVLSGFLIGRIVIRSLQQEASIRSLRNFWLRRWFRTLPNYFLFLLVNIGVAVLLADPFEQLWKYLFFLQHATHNVDFYTESWSLAVEEWFYVLFPLTLWTVLMLRPGSSVLRRALPMVAAFFLVSMLLLRCVLVLTLDPAWDGDVRRTWLFRLDAPLYGVLAAALSVHAPALWERYRAPLSAFGMSLFFVSLWMFFHSTERSLDHSFFMRTFFFSITSLSVMCVLPVFDCWKTGRGTVARWVTAISLWSYSLYLCQIPIHRLIDRAVGHAIQGSSVALAVVMLATAALSIATAALVYRVYELPMTALRERFAST